MTEPGPLDVAADIAAVFEWLGVAYVLGGSLVSTAFGEPSATLDVDFAADLRPHQVSHFAAAVTPSFVVDAAWAVQDVPGGARSNSSIAPR